jgi:hypothetical protein
MRTVSCVLGLSLLALASGCARSLSPAALAPGRELHGAEPSSSVGAQLATGDAAARAPSESAAFAQKAGDFVVYRFSGGYRKTPLVLTQRVIEASPAALVVDMTFDDGKTKRVVRARYTHAPGAAHELVAVSRVEKGAEKGMSIADLDAMTSETALAADDNEGAVATEVVTVEIGGRKVDCTRTSYKVTVGKRAATMRTLTSAAFPWGDVGGEITSEDGTVLYRAEVIDAGSATPLVASAARQR